MSDPFVQFLDEQALVIIPARAGSKGLPGKNWKDFHGRPLICHTVDCARELFPDERIVVSTDSPEIRAAVTQYSGLDVPFLRPAELATDTAEMRDVLLHAVGQFVERSGATVKTVTLLQPTSPLRRPSHLREACQLFLEREAEMVVSVTETASNPYYVLFEENADGYLSPSKSGDFLRRQDCPTVYEYNGSIYVIALDALRKRDRKDFTRVVKYPMSAEHSVDIDTEIDWKLAEWLYDRQTSSN